MRASRTHTYPKHQEGWVKRGDVGCVRNTGASEVLYSDEFWLISYRSGRAFHVWTQVTWPLSVTPPPCDCSYGVTHSWRFWHSWDGQLPVWLAPSLMQLWSRLASRDGQPEWMLDIVFKTSGMGPMPSPEGCASGVGLRLFKQPKRVPLEFSVFGPRSRNFHIPPFGSWSYCLEPLRILERSVEEKHVSSLPSFSPGVSHVLHWDVPVFFPV